MGRIFKMSCQRCGYSNKAELGGGRMGFSIKRYLHLFNDEDKKVLTKMLENMEIAEFSIENRLVKCESCQPKELTAKTVIELTDKHGRQMIFGDCCDQCGSKLTIYDREVHSENNAVMCPVCNGDGLKFETVGFWD